MGNEAEPLFVSAEDEAELKSLIEAPDTSPEVRRRARIILGAAFGLSNCAIARKVGVTRPTVIEWKRRYRRSGLAALTVRRPPPVPPRPELDLHKQLEVINMAVAFMPGDHYRWTYRRLGKVTGVSRATAHKICTEHGVRPGSKGKNGLPLMTRISGDPDFAFRIADVEGIYFQQFAKALAVSVHRQIPEIRPGDPCDRSDHDFMAALEALDPRPIGGIFLNEPLFLKFLEHLEMAVDADLDVHLLVAMPILFSLYGPPGTESMAWGTSPLLSPCCAD